MPKYNKEQQAAIDIRNRSILVSAPAGSGKTRILVARIADLIVKDRYDISEFLVLTFTDAAGQEMKQRLNDTLHELLDEADDPSLQQHIAKSLSQLPHAYITTFDSFCKSLLEKYGYLVDVMPGFEVNATPRLMQSEVLDECFKEWIKDPRFKDYASRHNLKNSFDDFKNTLYSFLDKTNAFVDFHEFLSAIHDRFYDFDDFSDSEIFTLMVDLYKEAYKKALSHFNVLSLYAQSHNIDDFFVGSEDKPSPSESLLDYIDDHLKTLNMPITSDMFFKLLKDKPEKSTTIKWKDLGIEEDVKKQFNSLKTKVLEPISKLEKSLHIDNMEDFKCILHDSYNDLLFLLGKDGLLDQFQSAYDRKKKAVNQLDFHDLEAYATLLLDDQYPVVEKLNHTLKEIMIDEYQDTNQIQENLVTKIANYDKEIPLFMVGDMKQAIYRFRQADPSIFSKKFESFTKLDDMTDEDKNIRIDLKYNYRSQKCVLDSINFIFDSIMDKDVGGLDYIYGENAILRYDFSVKKDPPLYKLKEMHCYDSEMLLAMTHDDHSYSKSEFEAHMVAQKIIKMKEEGYSFKDFAVLMRNATDFMTYKKIFEQYHIASNVTLSKGLLTSNEAKSLVAMMKALYDPYDDIALLSVLRNRFLFSYFDENTLLSIKQEGSLYDSLKESDNEKAIHFLEVFHKLREDALNESPYMTLKNILAASDYHCFVSSLINGEQRSANIDALLELARGSQFVYLKDFIDFIDAGNEASPGCIASDDIDAVSFMTIHKSKGLQFKVVFVSALQHQFNISDETAFILLDKEKGIASSLRSYQDTPSYGPVLCDFSNPYRDVISKYIHKEALNEEMRILYVALTRAEDKLILTGVLKDTSTLTSLAREVKANDSDPNHKRGHSVVYNLNMRQKNNYLDWILMALLRHPDFVEDLKRYKPDFSLKLSRSSFKELENEDTQLARFHLSIHNSEDIAKAIPSYVRKEVENQYDRYQEYYDYTYPYEDQMRSVAVTTLQKQEDHAILDLDETKRSNAASLGTLVHTLLSYLNFKDDDLDQLILHLKENQFFIDNDYQRIIDYKSHLEDFITSDLYRMIASSSKIYKEKPFRYKKDQIINGIFDLVFIKDDQVYVVDYKTDHITKRNSITSLVEKHKVQIELYKEVLFHYFNMPVKGYVYYLETNQVVEV